ncbi:MAG: hypothetical protein AAGF25_00520 [Pseudomonadota bacterium]
MRNIIVATFLAITLTVTSIGVSFAAREVCNGGLCRVVWCDGEGTCRASELYEKAS